MADYIRPTPRNPILGLLADALTGSIAYMEDPRRTQQMQGLGGLLSETGIAQTIDRLASGEPLTKGKGFATRMKPETAAAAMTLGPESVPIGRAAMAAARATKGLPVGAGIRQVAPQEEALRLAQQRAALPVSEGGLGLPANNTPMDRARAMGFDTDVYHGTGLQFDPDLLKTVPPDFRTYIETKDGIPVRSALWTSESPITSSGYALAKPESQVVPLLVNQGKQSWSDAKGQHWKDVFQKFGVLEANARGSRKQGYDTYKIKNVNDVGLRGFDDISNTIAILNPSNVRSRFAAFDPFRRNEPDLLAGALPFTALLDEENRARLEEQLGGLLGR